MRIACRRRVAWQRIIVAIKLGRIAMYQRILVAIDDSETSSRAVQEAARLARDQHAVLRLVYVIDEIALIGSAQVADPTAGEREWRTLGGEILQRAQSAASAEGATAESVLLETENVEDRIAQAIMAEAKRWAADLVVAGTHGRGGLSHLLMGSVAEGIMRHTDVPVLLVRKRP